jgi:hypothetical protein
MFMVFRAQITRTFSRYGPNRYYMFAYFFNLN